MTYSFKRKVRSNSGRGSRTYAPRGKRIVCAERPFDDDCPASGIPNDSCISCPHYKKPVKVVPAGDHKKNIDFKKSLERLKNG